MRYFTDSEMQHIAAGALKNWYGFGPEECEVTIEYCEYYGTLIEITCAVGDIHYIIEGHRIVDGSVCISRNELNVKKMDDHMVNTANNYLKGV